MAIRSVKEIINLSDSSKHPEKLAFKDLVKHLDPRIRERAPRNNSLRFKIPGILWGQPVFDARKVEKMIVSHYKKIGFTCERLGNREIIIKWGDDDSDTQPGDGAPDGGDASDGDSDTGSDSDGDSDSESGSDSDGDTGTDTGPAQSVASSGTGTDESDATDTDTDGDDDEASKTKCVTVEQIPLSKRLSIINNQMMHNA